MSYAEVPGDPIHRQETVMHILLRSSWQAVNIGDIAHTPGALALLERHLPDARVTLWASDVSMQADAMLRRRFPGLTIVKGELKADGSVSNPELSEAIRSADVLVHGSGPSVVARHHLRAWHLATGKPFGILGVTIESTDDELLELLSQAAFIYVRDTVSLQHLRSRGLSVKPLEFGPDATFSYDLLDDATAQAYLKEAGLEEGGFACAIPRLRYTPYFQIRGHEPSKEQLERHELSLRHCEGDHAKQRQAIIRLVREAGLKVLVCPEMTYEMELGKKVLVDPLPEDVRRQVVWRDRYWLPDEATSVYARSRLLISFEMHSPILAVTVGTPAIHLRQPTDTCKGQMWRDVGLSDWIFEIDETTGDKIADRALQIASDPDTSRQKAQEACQYARNLQRNAVLQIGRILGSVA